MKKIFLIMALLSLTSCFAQTDTSSVFIVNLPSVVKSDSNFILISESPFATYKTTWKNLQRSMNFRQLKQTTRAYMNDIIAITHKNNHDTTKGIKVSDFYTTALKDSVDGAIGTAVTGIQSVITDSVNMIEAQLLTYAKITSVDSVKSRVSTAESNILQKAGLIEVDGLRDSLYSAIDLKASVSTMNIANHNIDSAFASISLEAISRTGADSILTASINLKVGVNDVYSLLQILPDSIKIQSANIILDGDVITQALTGVKGLVLASGDKMGLSAIDDMNIYSEANITIGGEGNLYLGSESDVFIQGVNVTNYATKDFVSNNYQINLGITSLGTGLSLTNGVLSASGSGFSGSYNDLSNIPSTFTPNSHGNEAHSLTFLERGGVEGVVEDYIDILSTTYGFATQTYVTTYIENQNFATMGYVENDLLDDYEAQFDSRYAPISHSHAISDITSLSTSLSGKSDTGHTHGYSTASWGVSGAVTINITEVTEYEWVTITIDGVSYQVLTGLAI